MAEVGKSCSTRVVTRAAPDECCVFTVGKPTRTFFEIALRDLKKDGIDAASWESVGIVRPAMSAVRPGSEALTVEPTDRRR